MSEAVALVQSTTLINYCSTAASVLIFYEYVITFHQEVELMWGSTMSSATAIFFLNRYTMLVNIVSNVLGLFNWTSITRSCYHFLARLKI
ncbi:hypothetical protein AcW1_008962 [Taiwanofungus camphoratus]|nr:hypothetical protein AcW1_008962 [Antrodia cinnamomea]